MTDSAAERVIKFKVAAHPKRRTFVKKYSLIVAILAGIGGSSVSLRAQEAQIIVTIPFEFVVGSQLLPSGTYTVSRASGDAISPLLLSNRDHGVFLRPTAVDGDGSGVAVSFDQVGEGHLLREIQTPAGIYSFDNHREVQKLIKLAQSNDHTPKTGMAAAGSQ
jgi:hypothetical protein